MNIIHFEVEVVNVDDSFNGVFGLNFNASRQT